jgi:F0F1-type ATP synthase alpha subunit
VDTGRSVSRVGGKTQAPALRAVAEDLRLAYAQFEELEIFSRFGATTEPRTRARLEHGRRIREVLRQGRHAPRDLGTEVALLIAVTDGLLDKVPVARVRDLAEGLGPWLAGQAGEALSRLRASGTLADEDRAALRDVLMRRAAGFQGSVA